MQLHVYKSFNKIMFVFTHKQKFSLQSYLRVNKSSSPLLFIMYLLYLILCVLRLLNMHLLPIKYFFDN